MILIVGVVLVAALASASSLTPPVLPLIVRNPYLSTWLPNAREAPWNYWPIFWNGNNLGFSIMASTPETGTIYPLLGRPQDSLSSTSPLYTIAEPFNYEVSFDAVTTNITYVLQRATPLKNSTVVTLSFLSPITPTSNLRQSLPAAYFTIDVQGDDPVHIYTDVNGEWVSGYRGNTITWELSEPSGAKKSPRLKSWKISRETQQHFTETNDRPEWGTLYFTGPKSAFHESGTSAILRQKFALQGKLSNQIDEKFREIMDEEPVFAFAQTLDPSSSKASSITFTLSLVQDPVVQYAAARGLTLMRPLWSSSIPKAEDMIYYHYHDFNVAASLAANYSAQLALDASSLGFEGYSDIVALSARQVLGATYFSGTPDSPILFLKEISSNGNFQTVDVIFPSFPFFLYTNPQWLIYLLEPLIEHQLSGQYPNKYSMHDLGTHFPNATGHADGQDEYMPVEECGDMLIMGLAVVNALRHETNSNWLIDPQELAGNNHLQTPLQQTWSPLRGLARRESLDIEGKQLVAVSGHRAAQKWVKRAYRIWKQWAGYLVRESLIPHNQLCTDDFAGWLANQTNLALKGIIGIRAMSELSELLGEVEDAKYYKNISETYIEKWQEYGLSRDRTHAKLAYTWYGSWTTIYNLFADSLLCFHLPPSSQLATTEKDGHFIPDEIYSMQSRWYQAVIQRYGLPLDSRHLYTKSDWEFFAASIMSTDARGELIESVSRWLNETVTDRPFTDLYDTEGQGDFSPVRFMARPVVGGHFAPLALGKACYGEATKGLEFLDRAGDHGIIDVAAALAADVEVNTQQEYGQEL